MGCPALDLYRWLLTELWAEGLWIPPKASRRTRTARHAGDRASVEFEVTHPFHPWRGRRFVLATRKQNWGEDRVTFFDDQGRLRSLLASWTNVDEPDAFTQCSAGRSWLRVDDLLHLRALVEEIAKGQRTRRRTR
jgi:hypothetical protein